jgi:hypothetical protein
MSAALKRATVLRRVAPAALMPVGALAVHQLRYWLAFHGSAGLELQRQGHSYLHSVVPWIVLLVAVAVGAFLRALGRAFGGRRSLPRYTLSFAALWLICAACLVLIYACQEFLEGLFATGHPAGLAGIFGYGGWWSIPSALAVGLVLASVFQGARWVISEVAQRHGDGPIVRRAPRIAPHRVLELPAPRLAPLAVGWSGRGPPR